MRLIKQMTEKDFNYALKSIDQDYKNGLITRDEARESEKELRKIYSSGDVNRNIAKATENSKTMRVL